MPTRSDGERAFPTLGVGLAVLVVAVALVRELVSDAGESVLLRPAVVLVGLCFDIVVLTVAARKMDRLGWPVLRAFGAAFALNLPLAVMYLATARAIGVALGIAVAKTLGPAAVIRFGAMWGLQIFALWALGFRYPQVAEDAVRRTGEAARLREHAELVQLRAHLEPHFLRNTLNAIAALVTESPREARRLLATLGDLLSDSLDASGPLHPLGEELAWLRRYGEVLTARYHGALSFEWDVPEPLALTPIPRLLLQPLVENAALHGALARDGGGVVTLSAQTLASGGVEILVADNGPGMPDHGAEAGGLGLTLVRRRLALECPTASFRLDSNAHGTRAIVRLE